jgi:hypothetical protein
MIARLIAAAVIVTATAPAVAADIDFRAGVEPQVYVERQPQIYVERQPQVYVERQPQVYVEPQPQVYVERRVVAPAGVVVAPRPTVATAPLAPRIYADPADSNALYDDDPTVTTDDRQVVERTVRPLRSYDPYAPICTPGAIVRGPDGRTWLCQ